MEHKYYMTQRPLSIGAQPRDFTRFDEEDPGGRYGAIWYDRELTDREIYDYELTPAEPKGFDFKHEMAKLNERMRAARISKDEAEIKACMDAYYELREMQKGA